MAGDWIKMRIDLDCDPAVIRMAKKLGVSELTVIGGLHKLWGWADKQTVDGVVDGVVVGWVNRFVYLPDFGEAMIEVGWLKELPNSAGIAFPKFEKHNGDNAKKRALKSERQANWRKNQEEKDVDAPPSTTASTREEKRRVTTSAANAVAFDGNQFTGVDPEKLSLWGKAYPAVDLSTEMAKASAWLVANPKNKKSNYERFLTNWFLKAQERAPRVQSSNPTAGWK